MMKDGLLLKGNKLANDFFHFVKSKLSLVMDYYSKFPVVNKLDFHKSHVSNRGDESASHNKLTSSPLI